jgi:quercetin dioxygenase-like cupin family protein
MTGGSYGTTSGTTEREPRALMEQLMVFSLAGEIESLRAEGQWADNDKNSRTLAKDVDFRALLSVMHSGASLDEQDGDARASVQMIEGSAEMDVAGEVMQLEAGQLAVIDSGRPWTLRATADCALLLTFAWPIDKAGV